MSLPIETVPFSQQDRSIFHRKLRRGNKVALFFILACIIAGILWALASGYFEPLILAAGAILITLTSLYFGRKYNLKELHTNQKTIYRGIVRKSQWTSGSGDNKTTHYDVFIGENLITNMELYATFADNDEVEVHVSAVKKYILKKEIIKGTGNLEYKRKVENDSLPKTDIPGESPDPEKTIKKDSIPKEITTEAELDREEISTIRSLIKKRRVNFLISLCGFPITYLIFDRLYVFWDMLYTLSDIAVLGSILFFIWFIVYYFMLLRIQIDLSANKKRIIQTVIIDKEKKEYGNKYYSYLKTPQREIELSGFGYGLFQNHERIEVHYTSYTKRLIRIISLTENNKVYKNEKFFRTFSK
jgi:hypothetical protein